MVHDIFCISKRANLIPSSPATKNTFSFFCFRQLWCHRYQSTGRTRKHIFKSENSWISCTRRHRFMAITVSIQMKGFKPHLCFNIWIARLHNTKEKIQHFHPKNFYLKLVVLSISASSFNFAISLAILALLKHQWILYIKWHYICKGRELQRGDTRK